MKRVFSLAFALLLLTSSSGCCWWWPWSGCGGGYGGYGYGGYQPNCPGGNCAPATVLPPTGYYNSYDTIQAGIPTATPVTAGYPAYPNTAIAPLESLPTYR